MTDAEAISRIELENSTDDEFIEAFQHLINTGTVWRLQGWYGRMAQYLIKTGHCTTGEDNG
jgi:hypothetical protein